MEEYIIRLLINEGFIDFIRFNVWGERLNGIIYTLYMLDKITDMQAHNYNELIFEIRREAKNGTTF